MKNKKREIVLLRKKKNLIKVQNSTEGFSGKTLLVINTGWSKKRFIFQKLKKLGLNVIVLNKEKNWAQPYVDHWIIADTTNHREAITAVEKFISDNPETKINGALTFWEDDVLLTAKIIDKFNFIGVPYSIAKKIRNKYLFREFCNENGIPTPKYKLVRTKEDLKQVADKFRFPLVIKPAYGSSSAFVVRVETKDDLQNVFRFVRNNMSINVEPALSDGMELYVEEFIDGDEVDIDILLQNGKIKFYSIADNFNKAKSIFFYDSGQAIPSSLPLKKQDELLELAEESLEKLGVQNGCIHFEAKSTSHGPLPIEINLRMGGDYIYSYIKDGWNVDIIEMAVKIALGQYLKVKKPDSPHKYIIGWDIHPEYSGILVQLDISEKTKNNRNLEEMHVYKKIGDPVLVPPDGYEQLGWLTVSGVNLIDVQDNLREVLDGISYKVVKFDPASSIGQTSRKHGHTVASLNKENILRAAKIENIRHATPEKLRGLHIGIACNVFDGTTDANDGSVEKDIMSVGKNIEKILKKKGYRVSFFDFNNLPKTYNDLKNSDVDLVFNVAERINNSSLLEPHVASILDTLQIPYTGSNPFTLALCIDKIRVKKLLAFHDIPTPLWDYAYSLDDEIDEDLKYPLIVKPGNTDNSIGITNDSVVTDKAGLMKQLEKVIVKLGRPALIEEYIEGDEYDVSILGDDENDLKVLPLSRSIFSKMPKGYWHIYPFDAKWKDSSVYNQIQVQRPPRISKKLESLITEIALDTYNILDCHDYGRVEVRVDENDNPYVLELNPNPSINIGDSVSASAEMIGLNYGDFIEEIIKMAIRRYKNKPPYYHLQTNIM